MFSSEDLSLVRPIGSTKCQRQAHIDKKRRKKTNWGQKVDNNKVIEHLYLLYIASPWCKSLTTESGVGRKWEKLAGFALGI